jgi:hypothetical protein
MIRIMAATRIASVAAPQDDPAIVRRAVFATNWMAGMSLEMPSEVRLDDAFFMSVLLRLNEADIATDLTGVFVGVPRFKTPDEASDAWERVVDAIAASPHPAGEWAPARDTLGDESLAHLVYVSPSSLRRYATGERPTPDAVAVRLHEIARIIAALSGSYNAYGIRRWFSRQRRQLDERRPEEILAGEWSPDDADVRRVVDLAEALVGSGSAT